MHFALGKQGDCPLLGQKLCFPVDNCLLVNRQPEFYDWAFNLPRGQACQDKWDLIPEGVDVLVTHGPPLGHGDLCTSGQRAGCLQLLHTVQKLRPKYHIFGHIHEGR